MKRTILFLVVFGFGCASMHAPAPASVPMPMPMVSDGETSMAPTTTTVSTDEKVAPFWGPTQSGEGDVAKTADLTETQLYFAFQNDPGWRSGTLTVGVSGGQMSLSTSQFFPTKSVPPGMEIGNGNVGIEVNGSCEVRAVNNGEFIHFVVNGVWSGISLHPYEGKRGPIHEMAIGPMASTVSSYTAR